MTEESHLSWSDVLNPLGFYLDSSQTLRNKTNTIGLHIFTGGGSSCNPSGATVRILEQVELLIDSRDTHTCWATYCLNSNIYDPYGCFVIRRRVKMDESEIKEFVEGSRKKFFDKYVIRQHADGRIEQHSRMAETLTFYTPPSGRRARAPKDVDPNW